MLTKFYDFLLVGWIVLLKTTFNHNKSKKKLQVKEFTLDKMKTYLHQYNLNNIAFGENPRWICQL